MTNSRLSAPGPIIGLLGAIAFLTLSSCQRQSPPSQPEKVPVAPEKQKVVAVHEAAHAVVNTILDPGRRLSSVNVFAEVPRGQLKGGVTVYETGVATATPEERLAAAVNLYAGMAGEYLVLGQAPQGGADDEDVAQGLCRPTANRKPAGARIHLLTDADGNPLKRPANKCLEKAQSLARDTVAENAQLIQALADLVMGREPVNGIRAVSGAEVMELIRHFRLDATPDELPAE